MQIFKAKNINNQVESMELAIIGHNRAIGEEDALEGGLH